MTVQSSWALMIMMPHEDDDDYADPTILARAVTNVLKTWKTRICLINIHDQIIFTVLLTTGLHVG